MLSARRRVASGDASAEAFSAAFPLFCGEYTQGCQGGFPYLASKWSEDVGVVPERCAPYAEEGTCSIRCDPSELGGRYRATGHRYVTGGEASIIEELQRKGPLAASFRSDPALMQYTGGVWEPPPPSEEEDGAEVGFLAPTHSALLVGFGSDPEQGPYWVLQNAWGEEWGERGSFRIGRSAARARGLERFVVAADVAKDERPAVLEAVVGAAAARPSTGLEFLALNSRARAGVAARGHRGSPVCQERGDGADDEAIIVRLDAERNFRSLSFGDSAGTETAVQCAGPTPEGCRSAAGEGGSLPDCATLEGCECDLHGQELPFPGMKAMAERVLLMCSSAAEPVRVLLIGLGGGAISSFLTDRCPPGRLSLENIEKDGRVARLAAQFFGFRPGPESSVEVSDGLAAAKSRPAGAYDAVMVDCFAGADRVPEGCRSREFLAAARALLRPDGLLLQNAWGRSSAGGAAVEGDFAAMVAAYEAVFGRPPAREVAFDAPDSLEYVLFGLKGQRWASLLPMDGEAE